MSFITYFSIDLNDSRTGKLEINANLHAIFGYVNHKKKDTKIMKKMLVQDGRVGDF